MRVGLVQQVHELRIRLNDQALKDGSRILSAYRTARGVKLWVLTEADRSSTCLLLPDDY